MSSDTRHLDSFIREVAALGATRILFKVLAANDNSKNQIYFGSDFDVLQLLPLGSIETDPIRRDRLKAPLPLSWVGRGGSTSEAPGSQLILYPQYPEVRFSGFLRGASDAPTGLLRADARIRGRVLALAITADRVFASAFDPESSIAAELERRDCAQVGVFRVIEIFDARAVLLRRLADIVEKGWVRSRRLRTDGTSVPCAGTNCGGCTLEAELGIPANSRTTPDFMGWEIKAHSVSSRLTLMTPEPTGGYYHDAGAAAFIRRFGRANESTPNRLDFSGGSFRNNQRTKSGLTLTLNGFDPMTGRFDPQGAIQLLTDRGSVAAEWGFAALLQHWTRKHDRAAYVPYTKREDPVLAFRYGSQVRLGLGTDFTRFLRAIWEHAVVYDPGLNIKNAFTGRAVLKVRSQFRATARGLSQLYRTFELVDLPIDT